MLLVAAVLVGGCSAAEPASPAPTSPSGYYVDLATAAAAQVGQWTAEGRADDAEQIRRIAEQPFPLWVNGDVEQVRAQTAEYVARAAAASARPLLVAYNISHRDCGSFSGGGAPGGGYYRSWGRGARRRPRRQRRHGGP